MRKHTFALILSALLLFTPSSALSAQTQRIYDGDTITLTTGEKIRLLQIDAPELSPAECYGAEAQQVLSNLLLNTQFQLEADPISDNKDRYGRLLRYIKVGETNINLRLVELGAATPYFYQGEKGRYATQLLKAAQIAKSKQLGLWKSCPTTKLNPYKPATTGKVPSAPLQTTTNSSQPKCDPNYQGCIPPYPPDLDCSDIKRLGLAPVTVIGKDVHKLDADGDGVGCN